MPTLFDPGLSKTYDLPAHDSWPAARHRFEPRSVWAVRAALGAGRPLLLRGEPGIGKSQLARAVAAVLEVPFLYHVVDERSERDDLLYAYDAVSRLAQAQVSALIAKDDPTNWRETLHERNFIRPSVLWWAFDWASAKQQAERFGTACRPCPEPVKPIGWTPTSNRPCGPVVLVDEIDKADPSVPNGLLESLGNEGFNTAQLGDAVRLPQGARPPLVIITTNEERELPAAFLRRCLVLQMTFPSDAKEAKTFLIERARVFWDEKKISNAVCERAVECLLQDRDDAGAGALAIPGAAEFLDILRVLAELRDGDEKAQLAHFEQIKDFALKKNLSESQ